MDMRAIAAIPGRAGQRHPLARDPDFGVRRENLALDARPYLGIA
jgi:hypothetical protein